MFSCGDFLAAGNAPIAQTSRNVLGVRRISRREWHEVGRRLEARPSVPLLPTLERLAQALEYWVACVSIHLLGSLGFCGVHGEVFFTMTMWHQSNRHLFLGSKASPPVTQKSLQDRWPTQSRICRGGGRVVRAFYWAGRPQHVRMIHDLWTLRSPRYPRHPWVVFSSSWR